jgi:hypothetical protein
VIVNTNFIRNSESPIKLKIIRIYLEALSSIDNDKVCIIDNDKVSFIKFPIRL